MIPFFLWLWMIFQPQPVYQYQPLLIDRPAPVVVSDNVDRPRQFVYFPPCQVYPGVTICP